MKWLSVLLATLLLVSCKHDKYKSSLIILGLKGNVKTLGQIEIKTQRKGLQQEQDSIINKNSLQFNNRGNISEEYTWLANNHFKRCVYKFGSAGKPEAALKYDDSIFVYKAVFHYNEDGLLTAQHQYDSKDSLNLIMHYTYDAAGNVAEEISYWESGKFLRKYVYKHNEKGQVVACDFFNADSALVMRSVFSYNDSGFKKEEHKYGEDDKEGWLLLYKYTGYDKHGNWTERTSYTNDKPVSVTKREFTYY